MPNPWSLRIALFLFSALLLGVDRAGCDPPTIALRSELEDLQEIKSRLLVDFPAGPYGPRRFVYVENRGGSECEGIDSGEADQGSGVSVLQPQQWAVGFSGPLVTAGPVSLRGILAQLYNPLAHGPGSDVFTEPPELSLNIDLDVAGRRGLQLGVIPGYWSLLAMYREQKGAQLGSAIAVPVGKSTEFTLVGLLSGPPSRLEPEGSWYAERPLFPGGLNTHLAGCLAWEHQRLRFSLGAAASAGQWAGPGMFVTLDMSLSVASVDLALLLGYCSPQFFTPEGDTGDLEWIAAARAEGDFGPLRLSAACSKELRPLSPFPDTFRGGRDRFEAGIELIRKSRTRRVLSIEGQAAWQRAWSAEGRENSFRCLAAGSTLDWRAWSFAVGLSESRDGASLPVRDVRFSVGRDPGWGKIELEAGYQLSPAPGFDIAAALDIFGEGKRLYIRVGTEEVLPLYPSGDSLQAADWLELFTLRLGWEASTDWLFRRRSR